MSWNLSGTYFENCNCDVICPCTWSGLQQKATNDRCLAFLAFHVDKGEIDGVDVGGRTFAMLIDSPPVMADGEWKVGVLLDDGADDAQVEGFHRVLSGQAGGTPEMLAPLIGEIVGFEQVPVSFEETDGHHRASFGDAASVGVDDVYSTEDSEGPVRLTNVFHPANDTLTMTRGADGNSVNVFGISFEGAGTSGFAAPFSWSA